MTTHSVQNENQLTALLMIWSEEIT